MIRSLALLGITAVLASAPSSAREPDLPPVEQLKALVKDYQDLLEAFQKAFREVKGEAERD